MRYAVVIEEGRQEVGAYAPDLPGCGVVASSREEALSMIETAVRMHLESLREQGIKAPDPSTIEFVDVAA